MPVTAKNYKSHYLLALLLFVQAAFFSYFVTPLADVPDESGHYAYVIDLSKGRPFPVYSNVTNGRGVIPDDLWVDWGEKSNEIRANYIVQHPPLYYALAAIPYQIAMHFSEDRRVHAHAARLVSALSLGLLVLVLFKTLIAAGVRPGQALMMSSWLPLLPMMTHLSSGITNDVFLVLLCALATLYLVKFLLEHRLRFAYFCAFWLACAGATKMTAWILIAAYAGILVYELRRPLLSWFMHATTIGALSISTALWWMYRNFYWFGNPFFVAGDDMANERTPLELVTFFQTQPFFEWLLVHTYGLLGFSGYCLTADNVEALKKFCKGAELVVTTGPSYWVAVTVIIICAGAVWLSLARRTMSSHQATTRPRNPSIQGFVSSALGRIPQWSRALQFVLLACGFAFSIWFVQNGLASTAFSKFSMLTYGLVLGASITGLAWVFVPSSVQDRLMAYSVIIITLFTLTLFLKSHGAFELEGVLRGVQGRYLFPFYPLMLVGVGLAMMKHRWWQPVIFLMTLALIWAHLNAYAHVFIPFFNHVRL
jgi:hypothetical protein